MLEKVYNGTIANNTSTDSETTEMSAAYKLKTVLKTLNMSTFDYDIATDTIYVRKDYVLLSAFTGYWFEDKGDYYCLEHLSEKLSSMIRASFLNITVDYFNQIRNNTTGEMINFDAPIIYEGGSTRWTNFVVDTILDDHGKPIYAIGYCKDVHEQKKELYRLRNIAQLDSLTGFRNKTAGTFKIDARLQEEPDDTYLLAVLDLDKFKQANDLFGHSFGDSILKNVAARLNEFCIHDSICSRTGGDEFMFFRRCKDEDEAMEIMSDIKDHLRHRVTYQGSSFDVDVSIGFSVSPTHGTTFQELYDKADTAMYHAKSRRMKVPAMYEDTMESIRK